MDMRSESVKRLLYLLCGGALVVLGAWLRTQDAQARVFHADEGVQAYQAWQLIEAGEYRYDPREHHGPLLYYVTLWASPLLTDEEGALSDFSARLVPIAFGTAVVALALWSMRRLDRGVGLLWSALIAVAPLAVIYGAYYIQESLLAFSSIWSVYLLYRYSERPTWGIAASLGFAWGLMHVTKETSAIHIGVSLVVGALLLGEQIKRTVTPKKGLAHFAGALAVAGLLHALFFSSFGANPAGVVDGFTTYFNYLDRAGGQGHEKGFLYYLSLLWPHTREGIHWGELSYLVAVVVGIAFLVRPVRNGDQADLRFIRLVSGFGILTWLVYMLIPYKTPWLMLTPYVAVAVAAAYALTSLWRTTASLDRAKRSYGPVIATVLGCWLFLDLIGAMRLAVFRYPSASRNAYLYEHTTPRYGRLLERLNQFDSTTTSVGVYSPDGAWPLPWHLREWEQVGYWSNATAFTAHDLDVLDTRLTGDTLPGGTENATWELYGLRPNTLLVLRVASGLEEEAAASETSGE